MQRQNFINQRGQMAVVGIVLWFLLAAWSLAAFWQHIDELGATYPKASKLGAMAGEVALLALIWWHCFSKHINVRKWALIFSVALSAAILTHAGALRGMREAKTIQVDAETRLEEKLTRMSKEQMGAARGKWKSKTQQEIATKAQKEVAAAVQGSDDKVKASSILPRWYLDGWMYSVLFILSLAFVGATFWLMMNREDVDANYDGIPESLQQADRADEFDKITARDIRPTGQLKAEPGKGYRR